MTYTNTPIVVSQQTTGYTSGNIPYSSIVLITGIPHAAQLEVERIFTQDRDGSTAPLLAFLADPAVTTAQKKAVFTIPISRCTLDSITSNITAVDLPATGGTVYNYVITTPTPTTYTIKIPSLSQHGSSTVTVRRKTVSNEPFVNWQAGSRLTSKQLNLSTTQSLYLIQEALEKIGTSLTIQTTQITAASLAPDAVNTLNILDGAVTSAKIADGTIVNADINASAGIVDTKLATIATAGKVSNSATTATTSTTAATIALRDSNGVVPSAFIQTGTGATARMVDAKLKDTVSVKDFGAVGNGVADDTAAIQAAFTYITSIGGGILLFTAGTYLVSTQILLPSLINTVVIGVGATIQSNYSTVTQTNEGVFIITDGNNISFDGLKFVGTQTESWPPDILYPTPHAASNFGHQCFRLFGSTSNFCARNIVSTGMMVFLSVLSTGGTKAKNIIVENCDVNIASYGINCQNNGNNMTVRNFRTSTIGRSYFVYGVSNHNVSYTALGGGTRVLADMIISSTGSTDPTRNIKVQVVWDGLGGYDGCGHLEVTDTGVIEDIDIHCTQMPNSVLGYSLFFGHTTTGTPGYTTATTKCFNNIRISGTLLTDLVLNSSFPFPGMLDVSGLEVVALSLGTTSAAYAGFFGPRCSQSSTFSPSIRFGTGNTGADVTYGNRVGRIEKVGNLVFFTVDVTLTSKGVQTGQVYLFNFPEALSTIYYTPINVIVYSNGSALTAGLIGFVQNDGANTPAYVLLYQQGAAGVAPFNDTHFTNTTRIFVSGCFVGQFTP